LVSKYHDKKNSQPGPFFDDHDFINVNDVDTPWEKSKKSGELIEKIAWYSNANWFKIPILKFAGTDPFQLKLGFKRWLRDSDLNNHYKSIFRYRPSFSFICDNVEKNNGVILWMGFYNPDGGLLKVTFGHYIAVAGVNRDGAIAISDPYVDNDNPIPEGKGLDYHNNASIVSHDHYTIESNPPCLLFSNWWLPDYPLGDGALILGAIVISQIK